MDIYLVQPPIGGNPEDVTIPLGLLALAATAEPDGHKSHVVDLNLTNKTGGIDPRKNLWFQLLKLFPKSSKRMGVIGITTWSYNFDVTMELVLALKSKHPSVPVVLGGPHVTFVDREVLSNFKEVDLVLRDEGDYTFPRLLHALGNGASPDDLGKIPGLTWRRASGEVVRNPSGPVVEDMDALPYPKLDLVDPREYLACSPVIYLEAGRGCPYNCNFCSTTNMFQRRYRVKSPKRLVDEVVWFSEKTKSNRFELLHDNLVANRAYVRDLCKELRERNVEISWSCTSRTDNMVEDLAQEMFLAGCVSVFYGVESMDGERQQWTGKKLKPPLVEQAVELTARQHLKPACGIIVGFPDETDDELDATVTAALRWTNERNAYITTAALRFYPGADLFGLSSQLHYDRVAEVDNASIPGFRLREEWRTLTRLFALNMVHTGPEETKTNILKRNFVRSLLKLCPVTFRACVEVLGLRPSRLFRQMMEGRTFRHLDEPVRELVWNESVLALAEVVKGSGSSLVRELLSCEVPFWPTTPVVGRLEGLEHIVHAKRYDQPALLAYAQRKRAEPPPEVEGEFILSVRGGTECLVWFTKDPDGTLDTFKRAYAKDREGTIAYIAGLRRGLV